MRTTICAALLVSAFPLVAAAQDPTEELFAKKCGSCHTVGKGDRVGPDLKDAHTRRERAWLEKFIIDPGPMLDSDATARALLKQWNNVRMPGLGLSAEQAKALVDLIERCSSTVCELAGKFVPVTQATADDVTRGERLFLGTEAFKNGAPSCISCHAVAGMKGVAGGNLAKDLTHVIARLGDEGLGAALEAPSFALMNKIFEAKPLEKDEAFALRAYFDRVNRADSTPDDTVSILLVGIIGSILTLFILNAAWSRRLRGVRTSMPGRQGASS